MECDDLVIGLGEFYGLPYKVKPLSGSNDNIGNPKKVVFLGPNKQELFFVIIESPTNSFYADDWIVNGMGFSGMPSLESNRLTDAEFSFRHRLP